MSEHVWRELGRVCRLQIQRSSLKVGPPGGRRFDPAPLRPLDALWLTADGVAADPEGALLDIHNARHPDSKNSGGKNDVSVGFTGNYARMRDRFGARVPDGIAGENILVAADGPDRLIALDDIAGGLLLAGDDGRQIELTTVIVAHPCVEFSRYVMNDLDAPPAAVSETLRFLDGGVRGFYAVVEGGEPARVEIGDKVFARTATVDVVDPSQAGEDEYA